MQTQKGVNAENTIKRPSYEEAMAAVLIDAKHQCMTTRGIHHKNVAMINA